MHKGALGILLAAIAIITFLFLDVPELIERWLPDSDDPREDSGDLEPKPRTEPEDLPIDRVVETEPEDLPIDRVVETEPEDLPIDRVVIGSDSLSERDVVRGCETGRTSDPDASVINNISLEAESGEKLRRIEIRGTPDCERESWWKRRLHNVSYNVSDIFLFAVSTDYDGEETVSEATGGAFDRMYILGTGGNAYCGTRLVTPFRIRGEGWSGKPVLIAPHHSDTATYYFCASGFFSK